MAYGSSCLLMFTRRLGELPRQSFVANSVEMHRDSLGILGSAFVLPKMETIIWSVFFIRKTDGERTELNELDISISCQ